MKSQRGFTLIELAIVIAIMGMLFVLGTVAFRGVQSDARDKERDSDARSIVAYVESIYAKEFRYGSTLIKAAGTYPSWDLLSNATYYDIVFKDLERGAQFSPGSSSLSFVPSTKTTSGTSGYNVTPSSSKDRYVYAPMVALGGGGCQYYYQECRSFELYYRTEKSNSLVTIESRRR